MADRIALPEIKPAKEVARRYAGAYSGWVAAKVRSGAPGWYELDDKIRALPGVRQGINKYMDHSWLFIPPASFDGLAHLLAQAGKDVVTRQL